MRDHEPLEKWNSCKGQLRIPDTPRLDITKLHIYDFDNTLYCSPHPNGQLYTKVLYDTLYNSSALLNGGWWSEPSFLEQSFKDMLSADEQEQSKYWNQEVIKLAVASYEEPGTISIVLTGRKEAFFQEIFNEMFGSYGKVPFNAVCLKRANVGSSTAEFKISLITDFLNYYGSLKELVIYDDRLQQVKQFEKAFKTGEAIHVQPRFKTLPTDEEIQLVHAIFQRSNMSRHLAWTPKTAGFIVDRTSHRKLLGWTFRFFKKKYKMSSLPQWPMYIPMAVDSDQEIAKVWSNNDPDIVQSSDRVQNIRDLFYSQPNLQGSRVFHFDVVKIGYYFTNKSRGKISIFFKVIPLDNATYLSATSQNMFVIGTEESATKNPSKAAGVRWATLDRRIRLNTVFGHTERLTYVK